MPEHQDFNPLKNKMKLIFIESYSLYHPNAEKKEMGGA
jgi:hypothetical protein